MLSLSHTLLFALNINTFWLNMYAFFLILYDRSFTTEQCLLNMSLQNIYQLKILIATLNRPYR